MLLQISVACYLSVEHSLQPNTEELQRPMHVVLLSSLGEPPAYAGTLASSACV